MKKEYKGWAIVDVNGELAKDGLGLYCVSPLDSKLAEDGTAVITKEHKFKKCKVIIDD